MFTIKIILLGLISKSICSDIDLDIVKRLQTRYNDSSNICLDSKFHLKPAYECSGLLIRGVNFNKTEMKYPWSGKKSNNQTNSVSFAFLRKDQKFSYLGQPGDYGSGFIIYPHLKTPPTFEENKLKVFCAFPLNGFTKFRSGPNNCGKVHNDESGTSRECHVQEINSLSKWISHYQNITNGDFFDFMIKQCGFDMTIKNAAKDFQVALAAKIYFQKHWAFPFNYVNNELRIEIWNDENCAEIPIEAFFYFIDSPGADVEAVNYRDIFYTCCGRKLPIVGLRLPTAHRELIIKNY